MEAQLQVVSCGREQAEPSLACARPSPCRADRKPDDLRAADRSSRRQFATDNRNENQLLYPYHPWLDLSHYFSLPYRLKNCFAGFLTFADLPLPSSSTRFINSSSFATAFSSPNCVNAVNAVAWMSSCSFLSSKTSRACS